MRRALSIGFVGVAAGLAVASVAFACTNYLGKLTVQNGMTPGTYAGNGGVSYNIAGTSLAGHSGLNCGSAVGYRAARSSSLDGSFRVVVEPAPAPCDYKLAKNGAGPACQKYIGTSMCIPNKLAAGVYNVTVQDGWNKDCMSSNLYTGTMNGNGVPQYLGPIAVNHQGSGVADVRLPSNAPQSDSLQLCVSNVYTEDPLRPGGGADGNQTTIGVDVII